MRAKRVKSALIQHIVCAGIRIKIRGGGGVESATFQQTRDAEQLLVQGWASVVEG